MVTPRTGKPRGRPKGSTKSLLDDPERHAIAIALAGMGMGMNEQAAFRWGALQVVGRDITATAPTPSRPRGRPIPPGWRWMSWERDAGPGKTTTEIDSKAETLRRKFNDREAFTDNEANWLRCLSL